MVEATVKTVQYIDPRIEPQPDPLYDYVVGPVQNQYYKIPASGLSNSNITFNNLTTLGIDRAYLDTFEIELGVTITFTLDGNTNKTEIVPEPWSWTFDSFPFNKCCDEARVNINGGAFFSQPMSYIRAKERYMDQYALAKSYANICPCHRAICQTESGRVYAYGLDKALTLENGMTKEEAIAYNRPFNITSITKNDANPQPVTDVDYRQGACVPTRFGIGMMGCEQSNEGIDGNFNNSIVRTGGSHFTYNDAGHTTTLGWAHYYKPTTNAKTTIVKVKWREPIFVSPFSSRYDATYGRPLYNITSMDFSFTLQSLGNMIRIANYHGYSTTEGGEAGKRYVTSYEIKIDSAQLCYQVMTIPPILKKPLTTLVPYRRFVPYVTDYYRSGVGETDTLIPTTGGTITISSGVYTFNEMPTAIWVFCAPCKADLQTNDPDTYSPAAPVNGNVMTKGNWDTNKLFGYIKKINISMANTTQILATADVPDLYRIAKANGCEDSYWSWAGNDIIASNMNGFTTATSEAGPLPNRMYYGAGSVLRLKPGVDLIVPDQALIPGANANNMVFQCTAQFDIPPHSKEHSRYSLWLLFEYVGVAAISPGQCEITMNPLGTGDVMAVSPVMSATSDATEGVLEGSGFWDKVKRAARIAGQLADDGIISTILKRIPGAEGASDWAKKHGFGEPGTKRPRGGACNGGAINGGAVMGKGLSDWI